jgi:hypothetical protein
MLALRLLAELHAPRPAILHEGSKLVVYIHNVARVRCLLIDSAAERARNEERIAAPRC